MAKSLFSSNWYRVCDLKPRLRAHAQIHRQHFRGQRWYVLQNHVTGRFHRFTPAAYEMIGLMDGRRTVQEIWDAAAEKLGDDLPTQDDVVHLLSQLHSADALHADVAPDVDEIAYRSDKQRRSKLIQMLTNPLALRVPLVDPDRFLDATLPLVRFIYTKAGFCVWLAIVAYAVVLAGMNWPALTENIADRVLATQNIMIMVVTYPIIKALHELGHGYAVKRWGGEVHEMGVMFLVLMPVPYVDASAATAFRSKWKRALVAAAGVMVELGLAALALLVWLEAEAGMVRAIAFNVVLISGVSTLVFNGNPLLRFDGYYVFADLLELPNLGQRGNQYVGYVIKRYLFGVPDLDSPATAQGEAGWLFGYAVAAFVYRIFIVVAIATFVATKFFFVGVLLAIWSLVKIFVVPTWKMIQNLLADHQIRRRRRRVAAVIGAAAATVVVALGFVPVPHATIAEGVVWVPDDAVVNAGVNGFITDLAARPDDPVQKGDPLVVLGDPLLNAEMQVLEAQLAELKLRQRAAFATDRVEADIIGEHIKHTLVQRDRAARRLALLTVRSETAGRLILPDADDLIGRFVRKGELIGYVVDPGDPILRVVVDEDDIDLVRGARRRVEVRFVDRIDVVREAYVEREVPTIAAKLPSAALSTEGGGKVALDPSDPSGLKVLGSLLQLELRLGQPLDTATVGGRAYVRFDHGYAPIVAQIYRRLRQTFLATFNV